MINIELSNEYAQHPKVSQARKLLREAYMDLLGKYRKKYDAIICGGNSIHPCEHRHDQHGPSHNVNYTAGVCMVEDCKCLNFLSKGKRRR